MVLPFLLSQAVRSVFVDVCGLLVTPWKVEAPRYAPHLLKTVSSVCYNLSLFHLALYVISCCVLKLRLILSCTVTRRCVLVYAHFACIAIHVKVHHLLLCAKIAHISLCVRLCRAGRMGRELCISLTAVVLEAINTVEQAQHTQSGQRPLQLNDPNDQSIQQQQPQTRAQPQPQRAATAEKRRPSSERFSRGAIAAESLKVGARARSGSESNGKPHSRRAGAGAVTAEGTFHKEDPGLKDLDKREEEFRKVSRRLVAMFFYGGVSDGAQPGRWVALGPVLAKAKG